MLFRSVSQSRYGHEKICVVVWIYNVYLVELSVVYDGVIFGVMVLKVRCMVVAGELKVVEIDFFEVWYWIVFFCLVWLLFGVDVLLLV